MNTGPVNASSTEDRLDYVADADPDQEAIAHAFAELDRLTLMAERASEARKKTEDALQRVRGGA